MSYSFRVLASFILGLALTFIVTAVIFTLSGCQTVAPVPPPSFDTVVEAQITAAINQGYKVVQTQDSPAGQLAALVNAKQAKARIYYVTPVAGAVDYLTQHGWTKAAECSANGETIYMLQRDVEIPLTPGKQARN